MRAAIAAVVVAVAAFVVYWFLRALRFHQEAEQVRAIGKFAAEEIRRRRAEIRSGA